MMKKLIIVLSIIVFIAGVFAGRQVSISSIYGNIEPADAAKKVMAVSGSDSLVVIPQSGKFSIAVTPGKWAIYVQAVGPYKNAVLQNIIVEEGRSTDVGTIRLRADR
jgi:hypothetical protein